jgi:hypothetical protein
MPTENKIKMQYVIQLAFRYGKHLWNCWILIIKSFDELFSDSYINSSDWCIQTRKNREKKLSNSSNFKEKLFSSKLWFITCIFLTRSDNEFRNYQFCSFKNFITNLIIFDKKLVRNNTKVNCDCEFYFYCSKVAKL